MEQSVFWIWNGWGVFFTLILAIYFFLHIAVSVKFGSGSPLRKILIPVFIGSFILNIYLCGWIAAILSLIIAPVIGVFFAKIVISPKK
ncbi:MAG: hypothetical protein JXR30_00500 [Alphaproteobacteria bacterium]|nr:hypothetical protein [Alphaproteobacteria bacterium]